MVTNYEVDAFLTSLRDESAEIQEFIKHFLLVLDDSHNPGMASARARLKMLMRRDAEIGKHRAIWGQLSPWLAEPSEPAKPAKTTGKVIESLGVTPP
jgi:hypothetical protein